MTPTEYRQEIRGMLADREYYKTRDDNDAVRSGLLTREEASRLRLQRDRDSQADLCRLGTPFDWPNTH